MESADIKMTGQENAPPAVKNFLLVSVMSRVELGVYAYIVTWLVIAFYFKINRIAPQLFLLNTAIFLVLAAIRYGYIQHAKKNIDVKIDERLGILSALILLSALHWGVTTYWIIYQAGIEIEGQLLVRIILVGFAATGGFLFSIVKDLGVKYTTTILFPHLLGSFFHENEYMVQYLFLSVALAVLVFTSNRSIRGYYTNLFENFKSVSTYADLMETLSKTDYLTKVNNRYNFTLEYAKLWHKSQVSQSLLCVYYIEIDRLADITYQHGNNAKPCV